MPATPAVDAFIARWSSATGAERANYQLFLTELCALLELPGPDPAREDTRDNAYVFERRVVFRHGEPDRSQYRHYRMRTVEGQNDYGAMTEVLRRRFKRAASDPLPDLLAVDGGKAHLGIAQKVVAETGTEGLALAALAKGGRRGRAVTLQPGERERLFVPGRDEPLTLERNTPEEYLLQRLRDEAHRFAIGHHRRLRSKQSLASRLDDVPGVGAVLKKRLLQQFGGTRALARADAAEVATVKGVSPELARLILDHLQRTGG